MVFMRTASVAVVLAAVPSRAPSRVHGGGNETVVAAFDVAKRLGERRVEPRLVPNRFPRLLRVGVFEIQHLVLPHPPERVLAEENHQRLVFFAHRQRFGGHDVPRAGFEVHPQTGPKRMARELRPHDLRLGAARERDPGDGVRVVVVVHSHRGVVVTGDVVCHHGRVPRVFLFAFGAV